MAEYVRFELTEPERFTRLAGEHFRPTQSILHMATLERLERSVCGLEVRCIIQLCYRAKIKTIDFHFVDKSNYLSEKLNPAISPPVPAPQFNTATTMPGFD